jgi:hypothetical protein
MAALQVHIIRTNVDSDKVDYTGLTPYDIVLENTTHESMAKANYELGQLSPLDGKAAAAAVALRYRRRP